MSISITGILLSSYCSSPSDDNVAAAIALAITIVRTQSKEEVGICRYKSSKRKKSKAIRVTGREGL
jgi:hypothetical protein